MSAAVEKLQRSGDSPDLNSFVYATASVPSIRQAFFPLDAQVENKVLAKIQVISSCLYILGMFFLHTNYTLINSISRSYCGKFLLFRIYGKDYLEKRTNYFLMIFKNRCAN